MLPLLVARLLFLTLPWRRGQIVPAIVENMQCIMSSEVRMHAYQAVRGLVRLAVEVCVMRRPCDLLGRSSH